LLFHISDIFKQYYFALSTRRKLWYEHRFHIGVKWIYVIWSFAKSKSPVAMSLDFKNCLFTCQIATLTSIVYE